jgi:serine-type D-Ala-D-Ala carboxypeptidase (penicillin-binding protein 5/6)
MSARHRGHQGHRRSQEGAHLRPFVVLVLTFLLALAPAAAAAEEVIGGVALRGKGTAFTPKSSSVPAPKASATTWLIADLDSGEVLAARGAHVQRPPASTLKTLTAVALMPQLDRDAQRVAQDRDVRIGGGTTGMVVGGMYSVNDLWHGLLLDSGNETALGLAHWYTGDFDDALDLMQQTAARLQAMDTIVRNPHGLDDADQVSSVYDMALIARAAMALPYFREVTIARTYQFPTPTGAFQIQNENRLLGNYRGTIGGKTGYTRTAGQTFWGAAQRDGRTLLVVMFGISGRIDRAAADLLDWGFENAEDVEPVGILVDPVKDPEPDVNADSGEVQAAGSEGSGGLGPEQPRWSLFAFAVLATVLGLFVSRGERLDRDARRRRDPAHTP